MTTLKDLLYDLTIDVLNVYKNPVGTVEEQNQARRDLIDEYIEIIKRRLIG